MSTQTKTGTFEIFDDAYKVEYTFNKAEVWVKSINPAPHIEDIGWIREKLEEIISFHELENSTSEREFQKHYREEMISDESRGN